VRGVLNGCKLAAKRLRDGGRIVNITTSVIGMSPPGYGPYCATKAAVEAITRSFCKEVGHRGIRVNAVAGPDRHNANGLGVTDVTRPFGIEMSL
jgi:3-oxoacyl-[acyl-carrier protein] reductase